MYKNFHFFNAIVIVSKKEKQEKGGRHMMKKVLAAFLAITMAGTMLAGCGTEEKTSKNTEKKEAEEGVDEIVFAYMTQNNIPEAEELQRIEDLINDYTVEKINTKVDLVIFSNADYVNQVNLMLASGEKLDLFQVSIPMQ